MPATVTPALVKLDYEHWQRLLFQAVQVHGLARRQAKEAVRVTLGWAARRGHLPAKAWQQQLAEQLRRRQIDDPGLTAHQLLVSAVQAVGWEPSTIQRNVLVVDMAEVELEPGTRTPDPMVKLAKPPDDKPKPKPAGPRPGRLPKGSPEARTAMAKALAARWERRRARQAAVQAAQAATEAVA